MFIFFECCLIEVELHSAVGSASDCRHRSRKLGYIIFVDIDHEIIFALILLLPLIPEGHCQLLANCARVLVTQPKRH